MQIVFIGAGYVGLVSGACLADFGHTVTCIDKDSAKIEALRRGEIPIYEPGLDALVARNAADGRLLFDQDLGAAVAVADVVFIAVGTPSRRGDGHADLTFVHDAAREIAAHLDGFTVIATKSTVPVGTGDEVERIVRDVSPDADFAVVSNPEFLREGAAIEDFKRPDRIVVGAMTEPARAAMREVYQPLFLNNCPIVFTDRRTSELIKYASNAFLAMKITFINEMADLCEAVDGNVQDLAHGMGLDGRIGGKFLHAGPGYGGSCFPKDTLALAKTAQDAGAPTRLIETTVSVNETRRRSMARRVIDVLDGSVRGRHIAILGLTFKPNTDDMREAPSLALIQALQDKGARIRAYDPVGMDNARKELNDVTFYDDAYACAAGADALVIVTEWNQFRALDFAQLAEVMARPILVDLRNIYRRADVEAKGFTYLDVGRGGASAGATDRVAAE